MKKLWPGPKCLRLSGSDNGIAAVLGASPFQTGWGMMGWWGVPYMGFMMLGLWLIFIVIAVMVYRDAEKRGMNGLLWFILVAIPWIGIISLVAYLVVREDAARHVAREPGKSALVLLDERYARGELGRDEYLQRKKDIQGGEKKQGD